MIKGISSRLILLPFIYFYVLSFMVIFVSAYWLIATPGKVSQTYAKGEDSIENDIKVEDIKVTDENAEGQVLSASTEGCAFGEEKASKIDKFFENNNAPLAGEGCHFMREGQLNDIEPNLVAAIAMCESGGGKITPKNFGGAESFNAWGWAVYDSKETTRAVDGYNCDTWEHCIGRVSRGIAAKSKDKGLKPEAEDIVTWYTPASVAKGGGVPANAPWVQCVNSTMNKIAATRL